MTTDTSSSIALTRPEPSPVNPAFAGTSDAALHKHVDDLTEFLAILVRGMPYDSDDLDRLGLVLASTGVGVVVLWRWPDGSLHGGPIEDDDSTALIRAIGARLESVRDELEQRAAGEC